MSPGRNLCGKPQVAIANFTAQNGAVDNSKVPIQVSCGKHHKARKGHPKKGHKGHGGH